MNIGVVLAGGKGKRFKADTFNKTSIVFFDKPIVRFGTDLMSRVSDKVIVVVGSHSDSVIKSVGFNSKVIFAEQKLRLGTGHAVMVAVKKIKKRGFKPEKLWVGYGDHMMFYTPEILVQLGKEVDEKDKVISMVTCEYDDPNSLAWGRIIREKDGSVSAIIEQKDATDEEKKVKELNAGLYCFRFNFLADGLKKIKKSPFSGEYYLTDLIKIANEMEKKVVATKVPFEYVGIGINTPEELEKSMELFKKRGISVR